MGKYTHITLENLPVYVLGDLHSCIEILTSEITNRALSDCILIIAGDIGLGMYTKSIHVQEYSNLNAFCKNRNIQLILMRGNHDNPEYFNRDLSTQNDEFFLSNVKAVPDYTVLSVNNTNILLVGGATSIDRIHRKRGDDARLKMLLEYYPKMTIEDARRAIQPTYWESEQPYLDTDAIDLITEDGVQIEHVVTHTCPSFSFPLTKEGITSWMEMDSRLEMDVMYERSVMDNLYAYLLDTHHQLKSWTYGHYHRHHQTEHNGTIFTVLFNIDKHFDAHEIARIEE